MAYISMGALHPIPTSQVEYGFDVGVLFRFMSFSASFGVLVHGRRLFFHSPWQSTRYFFGLRCDAFDGLPV